MDGECKVNDRGGEVGWAALFDVTADGHRLRAARLHRPARGDEPTLVFLHEGLGSIGQWKDFPAALCRMLDCPGLVYERWGYGGSQTLRLPRPRDYLEIEGRRVLPEVLAACGIARPVLIGHSDGGTIALVHAAAAPQRVAACVTIAAHVFVEDETLAGIRDVVGRWRDGDLARRLARYHGANTESMFRGWAETWLDPAFRDWSIVQSLGAIVCPLLVIQGTDDEHGTLAQVEAIAHGVSGPCETFIVPECGHSPHLQAAASVRERIARFIVARVPGICPGIRKA